MVSRIMLQVAEAVSEIERVRIAHSNGDIFAMASEFDILLRWRNWATAPDRPESDAEARFTACLKGLCDNSLLDVADLFHENEDGVLVRHG